jgi:putative DNA primase/helicase
MAMHVVDFEEAKAKLADEPQQQQRFKLDDDILALELAPKVKPYLAHFYSEWRGYENGVWRVRHAAELRRYIRAELRDYRQFGLKVNQRQITSLVSMLEDELFIPDSEINDIRAERAKYINLRNGLYNLETGEMETHRRELYFTSQLNFDFDIHATCPTFHTYLKKSLVFPDGTLDRELLRLVKQALGYSMTARTDLKASFWLVGERDSGKSTFISVIKGIMGDLHTTVDLGQLATNRFLLSGIVGKRVVTFTEATEGSMLDDAKYKTLVGGTDDVHADVKNRDAIVFRPECKVWWAMNGMPRISDRSGATTRRISIIPFNRSIPQGERILNLEALLMAERSGIFIEAMEAYARVRATGVFDSCEQSDEQMRQYIRENDTEATFIEQAADVHGSYRVSGSELYAAYADWCSANGFKPKNSNQVSKDWRRLGFERKTSNGAWWHGLKLRT